MTALAVVDLVKRYGDVVAVDGVSLQLRPGELFAVIGPSGCGKTTLLRVICGLEPPDSGQVRLQDRDVTRVPPERRGMAMVFQNYALFPHLTAEDNVAFGLRYAGVPRGQRPGVAREFLQRVGLGDLGGRLPAELSGGQQQRVALARSLAPRPAILLLDEPLSNLDARLRESTRLELRALLKQHDVTALYVTHDQEEAMALADRLAVMQDGRVVQLGAPEEVYRHPASAFVAGFVSRATLCDGAVTGGAGGACTVRTGPLEVEIDLAGAPAPAPGTRVTVAIRPELCELGADGVPARVCERAFLGPVVQFVVELEDGLRLAAITAAGATVPVVGTPVRVSVPPRQAVLVTP